MRSKSAESLGKPMLRTPNANFGEHKSSSLLDLGGTEKTQNRHGRASNRGVDTDRTT